MHSLIVYLCQRHWPQSAPGCLSDWSITICKILSCQYSYILDILSVVLKPPGELRGQVSSIGARPEGPRAHARARVPVRRCAIRACVRNVRSYYCVSHNDSVYYTVMCITQYYTVIRHNTTMCVLHNDILILSQLYFIDYQQLMNLSENLILLFSHVVSHCNCSNERLVRTS